MSDGEGGWRVAIADAGFPAGLPRMMTVDVTDLPLAKDGRLRIRVAPAAVAQDALHEVDALTGATYTAQGVTNLLRFWLGEDGFGPFLRRLEAQGGAE